ncbi:hypothetical protein [Nocardiopsis tropica]|uniref:Uncharacterized protein n=1 Tax=Nocardiopsis tropica TaxID=109330 RepID=A0ABU7KZR0_9ACTN|nr:hypothetical protein [Nocardiopsis umidischolae]MEE2054755.1 hypothetical protein [Nocardiopsis umidischolae]
MHIPVNINLEVEGHGGVTACTVDIDTTKPFIEQLIAGLKSVDPKALEYAFLPQRYVIGAAVRVEQ